MIVSVLTFNLEEAPKAALYQRIAALPEDHPLHQVRHVWIGFDHGENDLSLSSLMSPLRGICRDPGDELETNLVIECADSDPDSPWRGFTGRSFGKLEPSIEHAERIVRFVLDWHDDSERVVLCVHCRQGHFRSGAVAEWVTKDLGIEEHEASRRIVDCGNVDPPYNHTILRLLRETAKQGEQLKTYTRWDVTDETTSRVGQIRFHRKRNELSVRTCINAGDADHVFDTPDFETARRKLLEIMRGAEAPAETAPDSDKQPAAEAPDEASGEASSESGSATVLAAESDQLPQMIEAPAINPSKVEWGVDMLREGSSLTTVWLATTELGWVVRVERTQYQDGEEWHARCRKQSDAFRMCADEDAAAQIPVGHCSVEPAKTWALEWARSLAQQPEQSTPSDETDLVMETVPSPRGRVVARWARVHDDTSRLLVSDDFEVWVFKRTRRHWIADVKLCGRSAYSAYDEPRSSVDSALSWIRAFVAPFGGELVVEGEP